MNKYLKLAISVAIPEAIGLLSSIFTISAIPIWYNFLRHPFFSPPNRIFAPVWTILYFLMGISAYLIWQKGWKNKNIREALKYYGYQLVLNFSWKL